MIVMKFGGTSVESAAAIERVAAIVKARVDRHPIVVVSAMGKTTNKLLAIAQAAIEGKRDEYIRQLARSARLPFPRSPPGGPARASRRTRPHARRSFSGNDRARQRHRSAGRTDAAFHRRHFELRRAPVELHRVARLRTFRSALSPCRFAQSDRHRSPAHPGRAALPGNLQAARRTAAAARAQQGRRDGRLHRRRPKKA